LGIHEYAGGSFLPPEGAIFRFNFYVELLGSMDDVLLLEKYGGNFLTPKIIPYVSAEVADGGLRKSISSRNPVQRTDWRGV